jgi:dTMP kinase
MATQAPGKFITLEGVDGAGKSTHIPAIAEFLRARGREVVVTREPGGTPFAEKLRAMLLADRMEAIEETLLVFAARADHVRHVIAPALAEGRWVVCDRFTDATRAYQGAGKGVPEGFIDELAREAEQGVVPARTLVFDCPWDLAQERIGKTGRALDRFEREGRAFFDRVRMRYLELAAQEPRRIRLIDASAELTLVNQKVEKELAAI